MRPSLALGRLIGQFGDTGEPVAVVHYDDDRNDLGIMVRSGQRLHIHWHDGHIDEVYRTRRGCLYADDIDHDGEPIQGGMTPRRVHVASRSARLGLEVLRQHQEASR